MVERGALRLPRNLEVRAGTDAVRRSSTMVAMPMPPPTQSVARPQRRSRRSSSSMRVPRIIAPVAPSGWPMAMAPPLTLVISCGEVQVAHEPHRDRGERLVDLEEVDVRRSPARPWRAPCGRPGAGPVSMIVGSAPETAAAMIRARGVRPRSVPTCSVPIATSAGAVDDAGGVAGVVDVVDLLDPVVLLQRHGVEAGVRADLGEATA